MNKDIDLSKLSRTAQLAPTTGGNLTYVAWYDEIDNCLGQGDSIKEAFENLEEAAEMMIEHSKDVVKLARRAALQVAVQNPVASSHDGAFICALAA